MQQRPDEFLMYAVKLERWLAANVADFKGPVTLTKFAGGQSNPTYRLNGASGTYVLRRKPGGPLLPSAHAVDREYRVLKALRGSGVPVPRVHGYNDGVEIGGTPFYVMDMVEGRIFWDPRLPGLTPDERRAIFDSMNDTIARLHCVDPQAVGLSDFGRPENFVARQIGRWTKQYRASETETIPAMDNLIAVLGARVPEDNSARIVHGDYRLDNLVIHSAEPRVVAVLDWELSTLGSPVADFAYHMTAWYLEPDLMRGLAGVDLGALGIPDVDVYREWYCRRTGLQDIPNWEFYVAFGLFRLAAICQGIARRALDGTASSEEAVIMGRKARPLAERGWDIACRIRC
jgi:aminoglycoside phosphotransferase (APT) family kinase protein